MTGGKIEIGEGGGELSCPSVASSGYRIETESEDSDGSADGPATVAAGPPGSRTSSPVRTSLGSPSQNTRLPASPLAVSAAGRAMKRKRRLSPPAPARETRSTRRRLAVQEVAGGAGTDSGELDSLSINSMCSDGTEGSGTLAPAPQGDEDENQNMAAKVSMLVWVAVAVGVGVFLFVWGCLCVFMSIILYRYMYISVCEFAVSVCMFTCVGMCVSYCTHVLH